MRFKLRVGIDIDDVLYKCSEYAIQLANEERQFSPPIDLSEIDSWGKTGKRTDVIFEYFEKKLFYWTQPIYEGAQQFIKDLCKRAEVFFITAVYPEMMSIRTLRLLADFPEVPAENIIIGTRKDLVDVDILLDDGQHNILASKNAYPVLMRRPWNHSMTGCLSVNTYDEFLALVDTVLGGYRVQDNIPGNRVAVLVGPSASGKTMIMDAAQEEGLAVRVRSTTTRGRRVGEPEDAYQFVSKQEFLSLEREGKFLETTRYASEGYGTTTEEITNILKTNHAICAMDICGAIAVKKQFPEKSTLIFVKRPKEDLIEAIMARPIPDKEKALRFLSLSDEYRNEDLCDAVLENGTDLEGAMQQLRTILHKEEEK